MPSPSEPNPPGRPQRYKPPGAQRRGQQPVHTQVQANPRRNVPEQRAPTPIPRGSHTPNRDFETQERNQRGNGANMFTRLKDDERELGEDSGGEAENVPEGDVEYLGSLEDVPHAGAKSSKQPEQSGGLYFTAEALDSASEEELKVMVMLLQRQLRQGQSAGTSSRGSEGSTNTGTRQEVPRVPTSENNSSSSDPDRFKETESTDADMSKDQEATDAEPEEEKPTPGTIRRRNKIVVAHVRESFCVLGGWGSGDDVSPTQYDENGAAQYWVTIRPNVRKLTPVWEQTFEQNFKIWGDAFLAQCRLESGMGVHNAYLKTVTGEEFKDKLKSGAFKSFSQIGKQKANAVFQEKRLVHNMQSLERSRQTSKLNRRDEAAKGTCLKGPKYKFILTRPIQSPYTSDAEDANRQVVDEPTYLSTEVTKLKGVLDMKSESNRASTSTTAQPELVYIKVDKPIVNLGNGVKYPYWAIDKTWRETHRKEFEQARALIDMTDKDTPQTDIDSLVELYGTVDRTYTDVAPTPVKPRPASTPTFRSVSPSTHRSASPSVPIGDRFASPSLPVNHANPAEITGGVQDQVAVTPIGASLLRNANVSAQFARAPAQLLDQSSSIIPIDPALLSGTNDAQYQSAGGPSSTPHPGRQVGIQPAVPPEPSHVAHPQPLAHPESTQTEDSPSAPHNHTIFEHHMSRNAPAMPPPPLLQSEPQAEPEPVVEKRKRGRPKKNESKAARATKNPRKNQVGTELDTPEDDEESGGAQDTRGTKKLKIIVRR